MTKLFTTAILATLALTSAASAKEHVTRHAATRAAVVTTDVDAGTLETGRSVAVDQVAPAPYHATYDFGLKQD